MGIALKYNTASQEIPLGIFVDDTDGKTAETALTIANTDIKLWKSGATALANKNSGGGTHMAGGIYSAVLDATDTDTIGPMVIFVAVAGALAVRLECHVYPAQVYDSLFGGTDTLDVEATVVTALATQAKADVKAEVVSALSVDTYAEPGQGAPASTSSLAVKIGYLFKGFANRHTQTDTTFSLYNDDATTVDQKATVGDDGTTFSRSAIGSGP